MKPLKREVTSVGVRDDGVASKGKGLMALGVLVALGGLAIYKSAQNWVTPEVFIDLVNKAENEESDEPTE